MTIPVGGTEVVLSSADVLVSTQQSAGWVTVEDRGLQIALSIELTPDLVREGMKNDFVRQVQQLRPHQFGIPDPAQQLPRPFFGGLGERPKAGR